MRRLELVRAPRLEPIERDGLSEWKSRQFTQPAILEESPMKVLSEIEIEQFNRDG